MEILEIPVEKINPAEYNPRVDLQPDLAAIKIIQDYKLKGLW